MPYGRVMLYLAVPFAFLLWFGQPTAVFADGARVRHDATAGVADLKGQLEAGLKARLPREFAFIDRVVHLVSTRRLPLELVTSTFDWARRQGPNPFPYFERALRIRAAKLGVNL